MHGFLIIILSAFVLSACDQITQDHKGPAPHELDQQLILDKKEIEADSPIKMTVNMTAYENISLSGSPIIKISPSGQMQPLQSVSVSNFSKLIYSKGESASSDLTIQSPSEPGYYRADLEFHLTSGTTLSTMEDFFVKYAKGELRNGDIVINRSVHDEGHTLKVDKISMTDRATIVEFSFDPATHGIDSTLTTDQGKKLTPVKAFPDAETGLLTANYIFAPTPISTKSLTFDLSKSQKATSEGIIIEPGEWKITVDLTHK